jgi:hypothetical protein
MATDCETFSLKAREIFAKLQRIFKPSPFGVPQWREEGVVVDNGEFDLRKSADRQKLIDTTVNTLGSFVEVTALSYLRKNGTLNGFEVDHFGMMIKDKVALLLILRELDFQIETGDFADA